MVNLDTRILKQCEKWGGVDCSHFSLTVLSIFRKMPGFVPDPPQPDPPGLAPDPPPRGGGCISYAERVRESWKFEFTKSQENDLFFE